MKWTDKERKKTWGKKYNIAIVLGTVLILLTPYWIVTKKMFLIIMVAGFTIPLTDKNWWLPLIVYLLPGIWLVIYGRRLYNKYK